MRQDRLDLASFRAAALAESSPEGASGESPECSRCRRHPRPPRGSSPLRGAFGIRAHAGRAARRRRDFGRRRGGSGGPARSPRSAAGTAASTRNARRRVSDTNGSATERSPTRRSPRRRPRRRRRAAGRPLRAVPLDRAAARARAGRRTSVATHLPSLQDPQPDARRGRELEAEGDPVGAAVARSARTRPSSARHAPSVRADGDRRRCGRLRAAGACAASSTS